MSKSVCQEKVFESIFSTHAESLVNFMYYKCGDYPASEDIVQEAFGKLWKECAKVSIEKSKSFLFTVATNMFLNKVKHDKVVLKFARRGQSERSIETPQYLLEEAEFKQKLELAISALPEGQRVVFLMNRIDKMKYKEIANNLGLSVKAIEKRMHKALVSLRKITPKL